MSTSEPVAGCMPECNRPNRVVEQLEKAEAHAADELNILLRIQRRVWDQDADLKTVINHHQEATAGMSAARAVAADGQGCHPPARASGITTSLGVVLVVAGLGVLGGAPFLSARSVPRMEKVMPTDATPTTTPNGLAHLRDALALMDQRDYARAKMRLEKAIEAGSPARVAEAALAECCYELGHDDEALIACDKLAEAVPNSGTAHLVRGRVKERRGDLNGAADEYTRAATHGDDKARRLALALLSRPKG